MKITFRCEVCKEEVELKKATDVMFNTALHLPICTNCVGKREVELFHKSKELSIMDGLFSPCPEHLQNLVSTNGNFRSAIKFIGE